MISYILFLLAKGLATIAMGLLLAIGFAYGNRAVPKLDELLSWLKGSQVVPA